MANSCFQRNLRAFSGVPTFCVLIYGLGASSLSSDEAAFMWFIVVEALIAMINCTVMGILVNEAVSGLTCCHKVFEAAYLHWFSSYIRSKHVKG